MRTCTAVRRAARAPDYDGRGADGHRRAGQRRRARGGPVLGAERGTVEKAARERMLELVVEIDGRPLSTIGCDGDP